MREEKLVLKTVDEFCRQHRFPPSISELAHHLGVTGDPSGLRNLLAVVASLRSRKRVLVTAWGRVVRVVAKRPVGEVR